MIVKIQSANEKQAHIYYEYESTGMPLGQGGMGTVYQGCCFREGDRTQYIPVAIKRLAYSTPELVARAMREASVQIEHDNLLRMYGFVPNFEHDPLTNGRVIRYYVVMESLQGVNLDDVLNAMCTDKFGRECEFAKQLYLQYLTNRHDFVRVIMSAVLAGVSALHEAGFVHRDLDPSNVMVTHDDKIKIIDFGISKKINVAHAPAPQVHVSGNMMGKVDYAAPEMIRGDVPNHNFSTDIYALGIMAYQLCTGKLPFSGTRDEVARCQMEVPVPVGDITDEPLREVIRKATEKNQQDRYQSVDELLADFRLKEFMAQETERFMALTPDSSLQELDMFVSDFPSGPRSDTIRQWIKKNEEKGAFLKLAEDSEIGQMDTFLSMFPDGEHYNTVLKWKERAMFKLLSVDSPKEKFRAFMEEFPDSSFRNDARKLSREARKHQRKPVPASLVWGISISVAVIGAAIGVIVSISL